MENNNGNASKTLNQLKRIELKRAYKEHLKLQSVIMLISGTRESYEEAAFLHLIDQIAKDIDSFDPVKNATQFVDMMRGQLLSIIDAMAKLASMLYVTWIFSGIVYDNACKDESCKTLEDRAQYLDRFSGAYPALAEGYIKRTSINLITDSNGARASEKTQRSIKRYFSDFLESVKDGEPLNKAAEEYAGKYVREGKKDTKNERTALDSQRIEIINLPIDKVNSNIWNLLECQNKDALSGQLAIGVEKSGSKTPVSIMYSLQFSDDDLQKEGIRITKQLSPFDKRLHTAIDAVCNLREEQGKNFVTTTTELYYAMGYTGKPAKKQLDKINESLTKMGAARIYIDNSEEINAGYNYPKVTYDGQLLPFERLTVYVNGAYSDAAIHFLRRPPLATFAQDRKQFTTIKLKLLQTPGAKSNTAIAIEDYLIERISRWDRDFNKAKLDLGKLDRKKNKTEQDYEQIVALEAFMNKPLVILLDTFFKNTRQTEKKQRQRAPAIADTKLDYFVSCGFIGDYRITKTAIEIMK